MRVFRTQSDEFLAAHSGNPADVRKRIEILERYGLSIFKDAQAPIVVVPVEDASALSVDTLNGRVLPQGSERIRIDTARESTITLCGWAVDTRAKRPAAGVLITVNDRIEVPALYGNERQDVARHFGEDGYRYSGFCGSFAAFLLDRAENVVRLKVLTASGREYYRPSWRIELVTGEALQVK
jgi:hypothetical protein